MLPRLKKMRGLGGGRRGMMTHVVEEVRDNTGFSGCLANDREQ